MTLPTFLAALRQKAQAATPGRKSRFGTPYARIKAFADAANPQVVGALVAVAEAASAAARSDPTDTQIGALDGALAALIALAAARPEEAR